MAYEHVQPRVVLPRESDYKHYGTAIAFLHVFVRRTVTGFICCRCVGVVLERR
jgi:hypothetical protein